MGYDSVISRNDAEALIPKETAKEIIKEIPPQSSILKLARQLPNMATHQRKLPVLSALAMAYFVNGSTDGAPGLKQTTKAEWKNKYIIAEEIACIVPIPEAVLDDAEYDIWGEIKPEIVSAFGEAIDGAIFFEINKPDDWPTGIVASATAAGNSVTLGSVGDDLYDDIMAEGGLFSKVEEDGYKVTGNVAAISMQGKMRGLRDANGNPIFKSSVQDGTRYELDGAPVEIPDNDLFNSGSALMVSGNYKKLVYSMRQDITYKISTESVIQDNSGNIIYNLFQQDMVALRAVMRMGWQVPNPINRVQETEENRYPFAVLKPGS